MPRLPRLQYENAIYHVVTRGDGRRRLFHDEGHYKRFTEGLVQQVNRCGWQVILRKMVDLANRDHESTEVRQSIRKSKQSIETVIAATAQEYGVEPSEYVGFRSGAPGRDVAAYLCRRYTTATLAELSGAFGLSHRDSSGDLVKRARRAREENPEIDRRISKIEKRLCPNPESRV